MTRHLPRGCNYFAARWTRADVTGLPSHDLWPRGKESTLRPGSHSPSFRSLITWGWDFRKKRIALSGENNAFRRARGGTRRRDEEALGRFSRAWSGARECRTYHINTRLGARDHDSRRILIVFSRQVARGKNAVIVETMKSITRAVLLVIMRDSRCLFFPLFSSTPVMNRISLFASINNVYIQGINSRKRLGHVRLFCTKNDIVLKFGGGRRGV